MEKETDSVRSGESHLREVKSSLRIVKQDQNSYLLLAAIHPDPKQNRVVRVTTRHGIPLGGYVLDENLDAYLIRCVDIFALGYVPISLRLEMAGHSGWAVEIPLPEKVARKYMTAAQKRDWKKFATAFSTCRLELVQMISAR